MRVFAISGSLRAQSTNTTLLRALALIAAPEIDVDIFDGLAGIPPFNPDLEMTATTAELTVFRESIRRADAVVISTPEYAHGMPGTLKNALDWIVGSGEMSGKPVALVNASARGVHAQASLKEVVRTMDARLIDEAEVTIDLIGSKLTREQIAADSNCAGAIQRSLSVLVLSWEVQPPAVAP